MNVGTRTFGKVSNFSGACNSVLHLQSVTSKRTLRSAVDSASRKRPGLEGVGHVRKIEGRRKVMENSGFYAAS